MKIVNYFGYRIRKPYPEEAEWFSKNLNIAAYSSDDYFIVINPYLKLNSAERNSLCINEGARLFMRKNKIIPKIRLTNEQKKYFKGTVYEGNSIAVRQTIIARIIAKDPSAKNITKKQIAIANEIIELAERNSK